MTYPDARHAAAGSRHAASPSSRTGSLLLGALMIAIPALAAVPAVAKDTPQQAQERQVNRSSRTHRSTPPARTSSAKPRQSTTPARTSSPPPRRSTTTPRRAETPRRSSPPARVHRTQRPNDSTSSDSWRVRTWSGRGDQDRDGSRDRGRDGDHRDGRHVNDHRDQGGTTWGGHYRHGNYYRNHRHHRGCGHYYDGGHYGGYYGGHYRYRGYYPWYWPWWPTIYVESDHYSANDGWGAIDLDVSPERAEIYLDGQYVGIADQYDGFPSYLWLEKGTYNLAVYLEGYQTLFRQVSIYPGIVIDVEDRMRSGASIHPDDYGPSSTERRDARIERNHDKEDAARAAEARARDDARAREVWSSDDPAARAGAKVGRLHISALPPDAAVYLDGHFLGTAGEIGQLSAGMVVEPGDHVIELVRPGYETYREEIVVPPGERVTVELELERD